MSVSSDLIAASVFEISCGKQTDKRMVENLSPAPRLLSARVVCIFRVLPAVTRSVYGF